MKRRLIFLFLAFAGCLAIAENEVPEKMLYCGIELQLDADARTSIAETITKLKKSTIHYQSMVDRANIYFPFVEEALELRGVPDDLKYIVIMESAFVGDAVSSSNAVGYWQFKEQSARESGITIDEYVDERKHIFQASLGAAKYFYTIARYFDNYLYAVIGYNRGPVGALPYIQTDKLGSRHVRITKDTHWYALKAIAHKLAFEGSLRKSEPPMWLQPMSTHGESDVAKLASAAGMTLEDFRKYNLWINGSTLPAGKNFIYYLPRQGKQDVALLRHVQKGGKQIGGGTPEKIVETPKVTPAVQPERDSRRFTYLEPLQDPDYGVEYVRVKKGESLVEISVRHHVKMKKIKEFNGLSNASRPKEGDLIYLKSPKSRKYHIVSEGEKLSEIAERYGASEEQLISKNRLKGNHIYAGQKLSLKKKTAKGAKPTLLAIPTTVPTEVPKKVQPELVIVPETAGVVLGDATSYHLPAFESKWVTHTVVQGESVWKIAKKYGAFAEVVKKINGLSSNAVKPGTELKILQVMDAK